MRLSTLWRDRADTEPDICRLLPLADGAGLPSSPALTPAGRACNGVTAKSARFSRSASRRRPRGWSEVACTARSADPAHGWRVELTGLSYKRFVLGAYVAAEDAWLW